MILRKQAIMCSPKTQLSKLLMNAGFRTGSTAVLHCACILRREPQQQQ
jgi:hypothetical protein